MVLPQETGSEASALAALREGYGATYRIRRTPKLWIATRRDNHPDLAPTIGEPDFARFIHTLKNPPRRFSRPFPRQAS
ncbi:hypothetical protein CLV63_12869 [Murinocardiopsis flavida]|uniref:Uncharacterized protein n=1 Tax=Murinocardiopsis flavida TaxID=645275 RepID=A0A2P8CVH5_9ACTN|nr:hypothetical protein [Murinocardiopsis flavida]PSK88981.1 hypothetical protein CLV63_12869 [Murinocardiopsis flavida]